MKSLPLKKAADAMRKPGARLVSMQEGKDRAFYVIPGGRIDDNVARKLMERPDVHASQDGLFPGHSQTWQMRAA